MASPFWAAAGGQWLLQGLGGFALGSCLSCVVWGCCQVSEPQPALFKLQVMLALVTSICQGCKSSTSGVVPLAPCAWGAPGELVRLLPGWLVVPWG